MAIKNDLFLHDSLQARALLWWQGIVEYSHVSWLISE